nr:putative disease resistance rpp13-like protein 1 [Quercus suber]
MSIIGEAALSSFFEGLFDKLASSDLLKIFQQEKLHADLKNWKTTLLKIRAVLDDAEEKQMTSRLVKIWLVELEDLAHDADDILDEFATEVLRRKLNAEPRTRKARKSIPACVGSNPSSVMFNANMRSKIEDIDTRLQNIVTDMNGLGLIESTGRRTRTTRSWVPTTSLVNEGHVYGRDEDKKALVDLLLSHELSDAQLSVIPIVGIGGLGKTTLVQLVYNDDDVSRYFDLKAWASVFDDFDIVRVTKAILESIIAPETYDVDDLNLLQVKLKEKLSDKKFLFILDDVWNEDYNDWTKLRSPFEFGAPGTQWAAGGLCYRLEDTMGDDKQSNISTKVRHFSYIRFEYDGIKRFENFPKDVHLRTFLPIPIKESGYLSNYVPNCLLPQLRYLRVLSLGGYKTIELPNSISDLKHLRYLNLSNTSIRSLPKSTSSLYNLQTLILKGCSRLKNLPEKIGNLVNLRHLDITDVNSIKEMPMGIEKLKSLRTLSNFVVGKDAGSKIGDLMNLEFLQGKLCISSLENVLDAEDARKANLNAKKSIEALTMKWENALDDIQDEGIAIDVLNMLRPHRMVKTLFIEGYVGAKLPTWLSDPSFSNMVEVRIDRCGKCMSLPAIGQLPSLKYLIIERMARVQSVGPEFYGEGYLKPFRSLETLRFEDMEEWKDWIPCGVEYEEFPCLRELSISRCPKLQGKLPRHLPLLETFSIHECEKLVVSIPSLPILRKFEIVGCKEVNRSTIELSLLKSMVLSISDLKILTEEFMPGSAQVETLVINDCMKLRSLWQDRFMSLETLDIISCPSLLNINCLTSRVKALKIESCGALKSLPISDCTCLEYATIKNCNSLTFISRGQLPPTLKNLKIEFCENLQLVVDMEGEASSSLENLNSNNSNSYGSLLEHLEITYCPSLKCLWALPTTLKYLDIRGCSDLTFLSSSDQLPTALKRLVVSLCPKLESVTYKLPASLEQLEIGKCEKVKFLPEGIHKLCHLNKIDIWSSSIVSFPDGGLLPTSLSLLCVAGCKKLETLPNLTSLPQLIILECQSMKSFPGEGFPTNLTSLTLSGVNISLIFGAVSMKRRRKRSSSNYVNQKQKKYRYLLLPVL